MRANIVRAVLVCAMAGAAVSCVAPHTMWGPVDYPQARKGAKVRFSSYDGVTSDITFTPINPCVEPSPLTVSPGAPATCTVKGPEGHVYGYKITPHGNVTAPVPATSPKVASTISPRALIVPCHGCIGVTSWSRKRNAPGNHVGFAPRVKLPVGAAIVVTKTTFQLYPPIECPSTDTNFGACAYQNQQVQWSLGGEGSQLVITFGSNTPCVDGNNQPISKLPPGNTGKPGSLPVSCAIGQSVTLTDYPYTYQIDGTTFNATLTVAHP